MVRLNEPPILTAKKNRKDFEAPILVVAAGPSSSSLPSANSTEASAQQSDFQPNEKPDINFTNNNNEGEPTVFSAESAKKETVAEEEKPARVTRSRKARDADSASTKASTSKGGRGKRGGRKKKGEDDEKQKDIREALKTPSGTPAAPAEGTAPAAPIEVIGEEATAHENDHELVVTPPSSPSALKEIQQGRKRPKKVSIIVRVSEEVRFWSLYRWLLSFCTCFNLWFIRSIIFTQFERWCPTPSFHPCGFGRYMGGKPPFHL